MKRFIQGEHRGQCTLLPESLDGYVADTNPIRVVDVFVDELDLGRLGFNGVVLAETGRPAYLQGHAASHIHFECIDQEEKAIAYARTLLGGADVTLHMQNALRFRPGHRRFDLVWSAGLFDYLDDREFVLMLKVLSKTLRPGGE